MLLLCGAHESISAFAKSVFSNNNDYKIEQAGAELCQAQTIFQLAFVWLAYTKDAYYA